MDVDLKLFVEGMEQKLRGYIEERTHHAETRFVRACGAMRFRIAVDVSKVNSSTTQQMDTFQSKLLELESLIINLERPQG